MKKQKSINDPRASRIIFWAGGISALLFLIYTFRELMIGADFFEILLGCVAMIVILCAVAIRKLGGRVIQRLLAGLLCFFLLTFSAFSVWTLVGYRALPAKDRACVVLVMGCRVNGYNPSKTLKGRLEKAYEILSQNEKAVCIVSGGRGSNEMVEEGLVMQQYLCDRGIEEDRIFVEDKARNTAENIEYSHAILKENGLEELPLYAVSSAYHLPRISLYGAAYGYGTIYGYGSYGSDLFSWVGETVREYMALGRTAVQALFHHIGEML